MKKNYLSDLNNNQTRKPKRWLGLLAFCMMLGGQAAFAQSPCEIEITLTFPEYGDVTEWSLIDGSGVAVLSGGYYDESNFSVTESFTAVSPPYSLEISIDDLFFCDNTVEYSVTVGGVQDISGTMYPECYTLTTETFPLNADLTDCIPSCPAPMLLTATNITADGATLGWTSDGEDFELEWGEAGFEQGSGTTVSDLTETSYDVTVSEGGNHEFYVRQICSIDDQSTWAGPFNFYIPNVGDSCSNPLIVTELPYTHSDDTANHSDNPDIEGSPGSSGCGSSDPYLSGNDVVYTYTATFDGSIAVNISGTEDYSGVFAYASCDDIGTSCIGGAVNEYLSGGTAEFELVVEDGETYYFVISTWADPQTTEYTLEITEVLCPTPSDLSASDITTTGATLDWTGNGEDFELEWGEAGFEQGSGTTVSDITETSYDITVSEGGNYEFYVRQICEEGEGQWAGPFNFYIPNVGDSCSAPFIVTELPYTHSDDTANHGNNYDSNDRPELGNEQYSNGSGLDSYLSDNDVVYAFTPTEDGIFNFETVMPSSDWYALWLFEGCDPFTSIIAYHTATDGDTRSLPEISLTGGTTYYVVISSWIGASATYTYTLNITEAGEEEPCDIEAPTGDAEQTLEEGQTLADLAVVGEDDAEFTWYADEALENEIESDTEVEDGTTYYVVQTVGDCTSEQALAITVTVESGEDPCDGITPPEIESPQSLEEGQTLADIEVTEGDNLTWYTDEDLSQEADMNEELTEGSYTFYVTQTDGECISDAIEVTIEVTLGLSEFDSTQLKVFPNPTSGEINISYTENINQVEVYNLLGQKIMTKSFDANRISLDVSNLTNGSYILILHANGLKQQVKIIKN